jgi:hypothetical protein
VTANKGLEYKPADYKSIVKTTIERKSLTIEQDQAECDEKSDDYKELEVLKQTTEQTLQEVEVCNAIIIILFKYVLIFYVFFLFYIFLTHGYSDDVLAKIMK